MLFAGIDIGTSSLKVLVVDEWMHKVYESSVSYKADIPRAGWMQVDSDIWVDAAFNALSKAKESIGPDYVAGIGLTGQMHTTVMLDESFHPVYPAIMWNDCRTSYMIPYLRDQLACQEETRLIARVISNGCPATNLLWMREHEPEAFSRIRHIMAPKDYLALRLTGSLSTDLCDASTSSLFDVRTRSWSDAMFELTGISEKVMSPIHPASKVIGTLAKEARNRMNLEGNPVVVAGTGDNPATAIALGVQRDGLPVISLGTSGVLMYMTDMDDLDGLGKHVLFDEGSGSPVCLVQGTVQMAGGSLAWWAKQILKSDNLPEEQKNIIHEALGNNRVLFYPHLAGEKTLFSDATLRGAFVGMGPDTTRADMTQAVLEGTCFAFRQLADGLFNSPIPSNYIVSGGGANSSLWVAMLANILHASTYVSRKSVSPGLGACILARHGVLGIMNDSHYTVDTNMLVKTEPDPCVSALYDKQYEKYLRIHDAIKLVG